MDQIELLTYDQVAGLLQCCERKVRDDYVKPGHLKTIRLGRLVRFRPQDVDEFILNQGKQNRELIP